MTKRVLILAAALSPFPASASPQVENTQPKTTGIAYLLTSFRGNGDGLHLASSTDGLTWTDLGQTFLRSEVGSKLIRDPQILHGPDGIYRMVWTTGWNDKGIGYATSMDLKNWSAPRYLPLMEKFETRHTWAPETVYDKRRKQYVITFSADIKGQFPETVSPYEGNNRTYYVTTTDFETFSEPKVLIDGGFDHIDTTIIEGKKGFIAVLKQGDQQSRGINGPIHSARSKNILGPYIMDKTPLVTVKAEGPTLLKVGKKTLLYVDFYSDGHYGVYETTDWKTWTDISAQTKFPVGQRHGSVLAVPASLVASLTLASSPNIESNIDGSPARETSTLAR